MSRHGNAMRYIAALVAAGANIIHSFYWGGGGHSPCLVLLLSVAAHGQDGQPQEVAGAVVGHQEKGDAHCRLVTGRRLM